MLRKIVKFAFWFLLAVYVINYWLRHKEYIFNAEAVAQIGNAHSGKGVKLGDRFKRVISDLSSAYTGHILPESDHQWIFVNVGGWIGSICLLHASLTEHILLFGTAIGSSGASGRYFSNTTDTVLTGTFDTWREGSHQFVTSFPGDTVHYTPGSVMAVRFHDGMWLLEYGRGFTPLTLLSGVMGTIFNTGTTDFMSMFYLIRIYIKALLLEADFHISSIHEWMGTLK